MIGLRRGLSGRRSAVGEMGFGWLCVAVVMYI